MSFCFKYQVLFTWGRNIQRREAELTITLERLNNIDINLKNGMGYLLCYISQALNKKWVNVNKAHNIPVTIYLSLFIKNQLEHLNYLALIAVIIFFVKTLYHS